MDSTCHNRVKDDSGCHQSSLASVKGGEASHDPSIREQGQAAGGAMDILQQIAQAV